MVGGRVCDWKKVPEQKTESVEMTEAVAKSLSFANLKKTSANWQAPNEKLFFFAYSRRSSPDWIQSELVEFNHESAAAIATSLTSNFVDES